MDIKIGDMVAKYIFDKDGREIPVMGIITDVIEMGGGLSNARGNRYFTVEWSSELLETSFMRGPELINHKLLFEKLCHGGII